MWSRYVLGGTSLLVELLLELTYTGSYDEHIHLKKTEEEC